MKLMEAHIAQLTEVPYDAAVKYKEQGFTVLGRTKHSHIAHRITGSLSESNGWYEYYIYPAEHYETVTTEPTFQIISMIKATKLFEAKHDVYITYGGSSVPLKIHSGPDEFGLCNPTFYITTELHNKLMNKRTPQQAFIDSKPAQEAWLAGKPLQWAYPTTPDCWEALPDSCEPRFADPVYIWRPKPEPEKVPFNQQTIPADAWFRFKANPHLHYRTSRISPDSVRFRETDFYYSKLAEDCEYSTDRINWQPCYIVKIT